MIIFSTSFFVQLTVHDLIVRRSLLMDVVIIVSTFHDIWKVNFKIDRPVNVLLHASRKNNRFTLNKLIEKTKCIVFRHHIVFIKYIQKSMTYFSFLETLNYCPVREGTLECKLYLYPKSNKLENFGDLSEILVG